MSTVYVPLSPLRLEKNPQNFLINYKWYILIKKHKLVSLVHLTLCTRETIICPMELFDKNWKFKGVCSFLPIEQIDDIFYRSSRGRPRVYPTYRDYCGPCPVARHCAATALATNESFGIWGGFTVSQLKSLPSPIQKDLVQWYRQAHQEKDHQKLLPQPLAHLANLTDLSLPELEPFEFQGI